MDPHLLAVARLGVAALAALPPARRVVPLEPSVALRYESGVAD